MSVTSVLSEALDKDDLPASQSALSVSGMGATPLDNGVAFRVWAPHAERVSVVGDFNAWEPDAHPLRRTDSGHWEVVVPQAEAGHQYRYFIKNGEMETTRTDPYAVEVTNSVGNGVIRKLDFSWDPEHFELPPLNEVVIYELHIGTFGAGREAQVRDFDMAIQELDHIKKLGANVIEVMPISEFAGDRSWGYNPAHLFAVEQAYGGPDAFHRFVQECHRRDIGVVLDVVYNHFGPSDLDLWRFDGWAENDGGGIYFYNDWRATTPWGNTRPDYGRPEVQDFILDNVRFWLDTYHVDGLRVDATVYVRTVYGPSDAGSDLPEGWALTQRIASEIKQRGQRKLFIAEDLQDNDWLTKSLEEGGAGFDAQWAGHFVHPIRAAVIASQDEHRSIASVASALCHTFNGAGHQRVIYSESHDEVANGKARVPFEIDPDDQAGWFAKKRSCLAAALVFTAPGIPMLFQGQEFLLGHWFDDTVPVDWEQRADYAGIVHLYRDLIHLRRNSLGNTAGLLGGGIEILEADEDRKLLAFRRYHEGGAGDEVLILANFRQEASEFSVPASPGQWHLRLNSDWAGYDHEFGGEVQPVLSAQDGRLTVSVPGYSALIWSQDASTETQSTES